MKVLMLQNLLPLGRRANMLCVDCVRFFQNTRGSVAAVHLKDEEVDLQSIPGYRKVFSSDLQSTFGWVGSMPDYIGTISKPPWSFGLISPPTKALCEAVLVAPGCFYHTHISTNELNKEAKWTRAWHECIKRLRCETPFSSCALQVPNHTVMHLVRTLSSRRWQGWDGVW